MKKSKKVLLLAGIATVTIGATAILHNGYMQPTTLESQSFIQAYKHNPSNILDNVYKKDNMTILPFIFENSDQSITKDKIVSEFDAKKLTITNISTGNKIGTGTQIQVRENSETYTVVIYGDTNGDGEVNVFDAQECVDDFVNDGKILKGAYKIAANVENTDNEVNVFDAQRTVDFFVGIENKLVVNEPTSIYETDNEAPVIRVNGQVVTDTYNMPTIKVGNTYTEPTVTATDNVDGDITASIIKSGDTVNTNVAGTYRVIYSVSDTKGNATQITIVVTVERSSGGGDVTPPKPVLTDPTKITLDVENRNISQMNDEYVAQKDREYILGTIKAQTGEKQITISQMRDPESNKKIEITGYEDDGNGNLIVKGKLKELGNYTIRLNAEVGEKTIESEAIEINVVERPETIEFKDLLKADREVGKTPILLKISGTNGYDWNAIEQIILKSDNGDILNPVQKQYIDIEKKVTDGGQGEYLVIRECTNQLISGYPQNATSDKDEIGYIWLELTDEEEPVNEIVITITFYKDIPELKREVSFAIRIEE